jgi:hypothetical protein
MLYRVLSYIEGEWVDPYRYYGGNHRNGPVYEVSSKAEAIRQYRAEREGFELPRLKAVEVRCEECMDTGEIFHRGKPRKSGARGYYTSCPKGCKC